MSLGKDVLEKCSKLTVLWHGYSLANLLHIFRAPFPKDTSEGLHLKKILRNRFLETNDKWYAKNSNIEDLKNGFKKMSLGELTHILYGDFKGHLL